MLRSRSTLPLVFCLALAVALIADKSWGRAGGGQSYRSSGSSSRSSSSSSFSSYSSSSSGSRTSFRSSYSSNSGSSYSRPSEPPPYVPFPPRKVETPQVLQAEPLDVSLREYLLVFAGFPQFSTGVQGSSLSRESLSVSAVFRSLGGLQTAQSPLLRPLPFYEDMARFPLYSNFVTVFSHPLDFEKTRALLQEKLPEQCQEQINHSDWELMLRAFSSEWSESRPALPKLTLEECRNWAQSGTLPFQRDLTPTQIPVLTAFGFVRADRAGGFVSFSLFAFFWLVFWGFKRLLQNANGEGTIATDLTAKKILENTLKNDAFLREFSTLFLKVQEAWNQADLKPVARYLSDGVRDRFEVALRLNQLQGIRNVSEGMEILALQVLESKKSEAFQRRVIKVRARAKETTLDAKTGTRKTQHGFQEFEELWSLIRSQGEQASKSLSLEAPCPSCGVVIPPLTDASNCPSCRTLLNSGDHGWVLAEITQGVEELRSFEISKDPSLQALTLKDPLFETQYLEDRASALLYRIFEARSRCRPELLAPFVLPGLLAKSRELLAKPHPLGPYQNLAVGSAQVIEVKLGEIDQLRVELHWNAHERTAAPAFLDFIRAGTTFTPKRKALMSFHCPSCGAPESEERDKPSCGHCGAFFNDHKGEWTLAAFDLGDASDPILRGIRVEELPS